MQQKNNIGNFFPPQKREKENTFFYAVVEEVEH